MSKAEIIENIGTIARSGTKKFIDQLSGAGKNLSDVIGKFGVGFYSAFIVAHKIELVTKSYIKDEPAYKWTSDGAGEYFLEPADKTDRGTEITVFLKDEETEFLEAARIENVVKKYSNFIRFPIYIENKKVNELEALWTKSASSVKEDEYKEFYKFLAHTDETPAFIIHKTLDAPIQFNMLIFCPEKNYNVFGMPEKEYGLNLYSNKIMIQEQCKDLIPSYFRFLKGIIDSADISLNISRETIQNDAVIQKIRNVIIKSVITEFENLFGKDREKYTKLYNEFNREIKEGVHTDFSNRDKLAALMLFNSSSAKDKDKPTNLKEYIERKKEGQKDIYYITGTDIESIDRSPYLELFKKKNVEVLYLCESIDEIILSQLMRFEDMEFKSIDAANLDFVKNLKSADEKDDEKPTDEQKKDLDDFVNYYREVLKDKVITVEESDRLTDSPCCLVNPENAMSSHIQKMMQMMNKDFKSGKKILQINLKNSLIRGLAEMRKENKDSELLKNMCIQLFENAQMIEGDTVNPIDFTARIISIMNDSLKLRK